MARNLIDLTGLRFGKLTVIEETRKNEKRAWRCKCECGGERISYTSDLTGGRTTSCGCGKRINIAGQKYGKLTALEPTDKTVSSGVVWKCLCDCGNTHYTTPHALRSGNVLSCGCGRVEAVSKANQLRALNLLGVRFGKLTVIEKAENKNNRTCWKCSCDCGGKIITTTKNLQDGHTISCGCFSGSKGEQKIKNIFNQNGVKYEQEKQFNDLMLESGKPARYDFYLPDYNCLIEYDGVQHFKAGNGIYDNIEKFLKTQEHDRIKTEYANKNNIVLIRIPYTHYEDIVLEDLLPSSSPFICYEFGKK